MKNKTENVMKTYIKDMSLVQSECWQYIPSLRKQITMDRIKLSQEFLIENLVKPFIEMIFEVIIQIKQFISKLFKELSI